jgi:O-antigen/teichoic acid export membrane protein
MITRPPFRRVLLMALLLSLLMLGVTLRVAPPHLLLLLVAVAVVLLVLLLVQVLLVVITGVINLHLVLLKGQFRQPKVVARAAVVMTVTAVGQVGKLKTKGLSSRYVRAFRGKSVSSLGV